MSDRFIIETTTLCNLIRSMEVYHKELLTSRSVIDNAEKAFKFATEGDALSVKLTNELDSSLSLLDEAIDSVSKLIKSLKEEKDEIEAIYKNLQF